MENKYPAGTQAFPYYRFSSTVQEAGDSIHRQEELVRKWAAAHPEVTIAEGRYDRGVSAGYGANVTKGELGTFIRQVQDGQIAEGSILLVEDQDRFSRDDPTVALHYLTGLTMAGIIVIYTVNGRVIRTGADFTNLIEPLVNAGRARGENRKREEYGDARIVKSLAAARSKNTPITSNGPAWLHMPSVVESRITGAPREWQIVEHHAATVRRIFDLAINGNGKHTIARILNEENVPAFRGKRGWHYATVLMVLKSESVIGSYQPMTWKKEVRAKTKRQPNGDPILNYYPAIIDHATWVRAQAAIINRRKSGAGRKGIGVRNLLAGIAKCGMCGGPATMRQTFNTGNILVCANAYRRHDCQSRAKIRYAKLEENIIDLVMKYAFDPQDSHQDSDIKRLDAEHAKFVMEIEKDKHSLAVAAESFGDVDDDTTRAILLGTLKRNADKIAVKEKQLVSVKEQLVTAKSKLPSSDHIEMIRKAREEAESDDINVKSQARRRIGQGLQEIITSCLLYPTGENPRLPMLLVFRERLQRSGTYAGSELQKQMDDEIASYQNKGTMVLTSGVDVHFNYLGNVMRIETADADHDNTVYRERFRRIFEASGIDGDGLEEAAYSAM